MTPDLKDIAIRATHLSKCYQIYKAPSARLKQFIMPRFQRVVRMRPKQYYRDFWALRNISFEVRRGETVGIVGRNGSGKSTLLQLICGTLTPTSGVCHTSGNIAALLELGTGFNPQFTGLENVFFYGQILGMSYHHINQILPDILSFADIGNFIHQPVKTYSSGMVMRLAFAVSVSREPEIFVVDEALAVGDEAFRRKCFARIEALRERGTTILFVSHAATMVIELCDRALLLDSGELLYDGPPKETITHYHKLIFAPPENISKLHREIRKAAESASIASPDNFPSDSTADTSSEKKEIQPQYVEGLVSQSRIDYDQLGAAIVDPRIETLDEERVNILIAMQEYRYCYQVKFFQNARRIQFGMLIKNISGVEIGGALHPSLFEHIDSVMAGEEFQVSFKFRCQLNPGTYFFNSGIQGLTGVDSKKTYLHRIIDAVMFKVQPYREREATAIVNFDISSITTRNKKLK
ncbi:ABC transporter, ATP-binding protein, putative function in lipopolysaccharide export [Desulfococcus multivorans]|nr:ABC transporter, ATP-binding protein, putative function in lipopolysaccharide export [Desulfococcus multivorans]